MHAWKTLVTSQIFHILYIMQAVSAWYDIAYAFRKQCTNIFIKFYILMKFYQNHGYWERLHKVWLLLSSNGTVSNRNQACWFVACNWMWVGFFFHKWWMADSVSGVRSSNLYVRRLAMLTTRRCRHSAAISDHWCGKACHSLTRLYGWYPISLSACHHSSQRCYIGLQSGNCKGCSIRVTS